MKAAQELFEPGEYIKTHEPGYFSILAKPDSRARQDSYPVKHMKTVIEGVNPHIDTWISQAVFYQPNRRAVNMRSVGLLFCDLDTYHVENLKNRDPEEQAHLLVEYCNMEGIPIPSLILFSGRGLQAKWFLSEALGADALPDWNQVQRALVLLLEQFASDMNARDISRVLRLDKTTNTKSGEQCRVVWTLSGSDAVIARYNFEELSETLLERVPQQPEPKKAAKPGNKIITLPARFSLQKLNWFRLYDLIDLWSLRGGVPVGVREITLFWQLNFLMRAEPVRVQDFWKEAQALAGKIDSRDGWYRNSDLSTLYRRAIETFKGNTTTYRGREMPALYTPRNTTLIDVFAITPDEEQHLRTIISQSEKYRRKVEKRRAEGVQEQPYRNHKPWEELGISRRWFYELKERGGLLNKYTDNQDQEQYHKSRDKVCTVGGFHKSRDKLSTDGGEI